MQQAARYIGTTFVVYFTLGIAATFLDILAANEYMLYMYANEWPPALWRTLISSSYTGVALAVWMCAVACYHIWTQHSGYPPLWPRLTEHSRLFSNSWSVTTMLVGGVMLAAMINISLDNYEWAYRSIIRRGASEETLLKSAMAWPIFLVWGVVWSADISRNSDIRQRVGWGWYISIFVILVCLYTWFITLATAREF